MNRREVVSPFNSDPGGLSFLFVFWLAGALLLLPCANGFSQQSVTNNTSTNLGDLSLEALMQIEVPVVTGASKVAQKTTDAPASVTIIGGDQIQKYGDRTLADVLRTVQGFNVSYDRDYAFLDARGLSLGDFNSRILLLVDGHRVNNNLTDGAFIDTAFILDMDLVDHIEIIRGPSSVLYGNNAFFGIINVITRQGGQLNGLETSAEYGSFDAFKLRATYGRVFTNKLEFLVSGSFYDSQGQENLYYPQFNQPLQNNGVAHDMDGDSYKSLFGSLKYTDFSLESGFITREKRNPTGQYSQELNPGLLTTFDDPRLTTSDNRSYADLKFAHSFPDVVDVMARVYYDRYRHDIGYPFSYINGDTVTPIPFSSETDLGQWWGSEIELSKRVWDKHTLTLGAEYRDDFQQEEEITGQPAIKLTRQSCGVYAQGDFELLNQLHLDAGVRYDKASDYPSAVTPRLALIYHPAESATLKAIYGTAFRTPNFYETTGELQPLEPEKIQTYELDYEQQWGPHIRSTASIFYNNMDDLIVFNSGSFTNFNADTRGVELGLEGIFADGIRGRASYSYQYTRDKSLAWEMPDSPNHLVKLNLSVPVWSEKLFADLEFQFVSQRASLHSTTDSEGEPLTVQGETAGAYGLVNFTLFSKEIVKHLEVSASVYNLLNSHYSDPASRFHVQDLIPQDGRTFRLKATYRF